MTQAAPAPADKGGGGGQGGAQRGGGQSAGGGERGGGQSGGRRAEAAANDPIPVLEGGRVVGQKTPEDARKEGLTVVDLSDDWLPTSSRRRRTSRSRCGRFCSTWRTGGSRTGRQYARPHEDRFFEVFGIFPSLNLVRRRLADKKRHACHDKVKDGVLEELSAKNVIPPEELEKVPNPNPETRAETPMVTTGRTDLAAAFDRARKAGRDRDAGPPALRGHAARQGDPGPDGSLDPEGLKVYQHLHQLADNSKIDADIRAVLLGDSREHDFRLLLRVLRERIVDATGLLEDGSALGAQGQVQGGCWTAPSSSRWRCRRKGAIRRAAPRRTPLRRRARPLRRPRATRRRRRRVGQDHPGARSDRAGHPRGQPRRWAGSHRRPGSRTSCRRPRRRRERRRARERRR